MNLFLPWEWADTSGYVIWMGLFVVVTVGLLVKLAGTSWEDWLDERWGRGSIRDWWLLGRNGGKGRGGTDRQPRR